MIQTLDVLGALGRSTKSTVGVYLDMKQVMPMGKIISTAIRLNPSLTNDDVENRADALAQWLATIPIAMGEGRWFQMIETIDVVWHAFILHTREYAAFCEQFYGGFLHHDPPMNYDDDRSEYASYTLAMLRREFGGAINPLLEDLSTNVKCCYRYSIE